MMRIAIFLFLALMHGLAGAAGLDPKMQALCKRAVDKPFKVAGTTGQLDDELLRMLVVTDDTAALQHKIAGSDINAPHGKFGTTALAFAAGVGNAKAVVWFIAQGADIDRPNRLGVSPLSYALTSGKLGTACILIERGATLPDPSTGENLLVSAAVSEDFDDAAAMVDFFAQRGFDVNAAPFGMTPLHIAAELGNEALARLLLQRGARVDAENAQGETPEAVAMRTGHAKIANILKKARARRP